MLCHRWTPYRATLGALSIAATLLASGCASGDTARRVLAEVGELRSQVAELRRGQEASARELAQMASDLEALQAQGAALAEGSGALGQQVGVLQSALAESDASLRALRAAVDELPRTPVVVTAPPPELRPQPEPVKDSSAPERLFSTALANFQAQEHGQAVLDFTELITRFPRHPLASSAQFWVGEAYYRQHDFRQALVEFQKVVDAYPRSQQVAEALLKIGLCHRALHDTARARETWERLVREHPGSEATTQARSLLGSRGTSTRGAR